MLLKIFSDLYWLCVLFISADNFSTSFLGPIFKRSTFFERIFNLVGVLKEVIFYFPL